MQLDHFCFKIFINSPENIESKECIRIFHSWIQNEKLETTLIDVIDYSHVERGPGVFLIGHESDYSIETGPENKWGLFYKSKISQGQITTQRIVDSFSDALVACNEFANDGCWNGELEFNKQEFNLFINDRLLAKNDVSTFNDVSNDLKAGLEKSFGHSEFNLEFINSDSRNLFGVKVALQKELNI